ncbi:11974_t:CDS:2 [Racocetra fulgida]|uniref:11974_t:CDS:1 n=1 Tax=Racocetra fulgida TaxID=60492 RepID=A0A9N8WA81_9GLOM|nr:11974_t:CDS:2 [Racocetra fulgida]
MEIEPMEVEPEPMEMELPEVGSMDVESAELGLTEVESDVLVEIDEKTKMRLAIEELDGMAIDILEIAIPDTMLVFGFDNSSSHRAFAEDALVASRMNVGFGGKQSKMRPSRFSDSTSQEIVFSLNHQNKKKEDNQKELQK